MRKESKFTESCRRVHSARFAAARRCKARGPFWNTPTYINTFMGISTFMGIWCVCKRSQGATQSVVLQHFRPFNLDKLFKGGPNIRIHFLCIIILDSAILSFNTLHFKSVVFLMSKRKEKAHKEEGNIKKKGGQSVRGRIKHNKKGERAKLRNRSNK